eukprot:COSAG05_NODE_90_length_20140_cov_25.117060_11_plen_135_part_00
MEEEASVVPTGPFICRPCGRSEMGAAAAAASAQTVCRFCFGLPCWQGCLPRRASCGAFGQGYELAGNRAARLPHAQQTRTWPRAERPYLARLGRFFDRAGRALRSFCRGSGTELLWTVEALCRTPDKTVPRSGS